MSQTTDVTVSISDVVRELVGYYLRRFELERAYDINDGLCEQFARDVCDRVPGAEAFWGDELEGTEDSAFFDHKVIVYEGRYYDSECPEGVDEWLEIPFFKEIADGVAGPDELLEIGHYRPGVNDG